MKNLEYLKGQLDAYSGLGDSSIHIFDSNIKGRPISSKVTALSKESFKQNAQKVIQINCLKFLDTDKVNLEALVKGLITQIYTTILPLELYEYKENEDTHFFILHTRKANYCLVIYNNCDITPEYKERFQMIANSLLSEINS